LLAAAEAHARAALSWIHLLLGEGSVGGKPRAFFDLFRVENGKLAEHWDTVATIPDRSTWRNPNGKF